MNIDDILICPNVSESGNLPTGANPVFAFAMNGPITLIFVIFGCLGNGYSIYLLTRKLNIRRTVVYYLCTLAVWDTALLMFSFGYYGLGAFVEYYRWNVKKFM